MDLQAVAMKQWTFGLLVASLERCWRVGGHCFLAKVMPIRYSRDTYNGVSRRCLSVTQGSGEHALLTSRGVKMFLRSMALFISLSSTRMTYFVRIFGVHSLPQLRQTLAAVGKPDYMERDGALGYKLEEGVLKFLRSLEPPSGEDQRLLRLVKPDTHASREDKSNGENVAFWYQPRRGTIPDNAVALMTGG